MGPRNGVPATHSASQTRVNALLLSRGAPRGDERKNIGTLPTFHSAASADLPERFFNSSRAITTFCTSVAPS